MKKKVALITGISGQDGSYLAEFLLEKNYVVHGIKRRSSSFNTKRIDHLIEGAARDNFILHYGDLADSLSCVDIIGKVCPDEIYNLGAQSHVAVSFEVPEYTANVNALGPLRIFEAVRMMSMEKSVKIYQASSSELFGLVQEFPQKETTPFYPRSPYAVSKLFAYWIGVNYRESYKMFIANGILFNHESSRRGETFVTRKITRGLTNIAFGIEKCIYLGNLDAKRDWGHAKDYVRMQWLMLQQDKPVDYVISTGKQYSVRDFIIASAKKIGVELEFTNKGIKEEGKVVVVDKKIAPFINKGDVIVKVSAKYFRPSEVDTLCGDSSKAAKDLNWVPEFDLELLIDEMMTNDYVQAKQRLVLKDAGY